MNVFIGLVTHAGTHYPESSSAEGLAVSLQRALAAEGFSVNLEIFDQDLWTPQVLDIKAEVVRRSIVAELEVEKRWRTLHKAAELSPVAKLVLRVRGWYRLRRYVGSGPTSANVHRGQAMVKRLVNIELAHVHLMQRAIDSGSQWALIIEDDAHGNVHDVAETLRALISHGATSGQPAFVNMSRSFTQRRLGVGEGLTELTISGPSGSDFGFLLSPKPVTNTVCAVLYRTSFLSGLVRHLTSMPIDPVIPIDWKINSVLMNMYQAHEVGDGDSWLCVDAPIVQGSMHGE
jgi:hypothetical protein